MKFRTTLFAALAALIVFVLPTLAESPAVDPRTLTEANLGAECATLDTIPEVTPEAVVLNESIGHEAVAYIWAEGIMVRGMAVVTGWVGPSALAHVEVRSQKPAQSFTVGYTYIRSFAGSSSIYLPFELTADFTTVDDVTSVNITMDLREQSGYEVDIDHMYTDVIRLETDYDRRIYGEFRNEVKIADQVVETDFGCYGLSIPSLPQIDPPHAAYRLIAVDDSENPTIIIDKTFHSYIEMELWLGVVSHVSLRGVVIIDTDGNGSPEMAAPVVGTMFVTPFNG
jgi:hypothetical protein